MMSIYDIMLSLFPKSTAAKAITADRGEVACTFLSRLALHELSSHAVQAGDIKQKIPLARKDFTSPFGPLTTCFVDTLDINRSLNGATSATSECGYMRILLYVGSVSSRSQCDDVNDKSRFPFPMQPSITPIDRQQIWICRIRQPIITR